MKSKIYLALALIATFLSLSLPIVAAPIPGLGQCMARYTQKVIYVGCDASCDANGQHCSWHYYSAPFSPSAPIDGNDLPGSWVKRYGHGIGLAWTQAHGLPASYAECGNLVGERFSQYRVIPKLHDLCPEIPLASIPSVDTNLDSLPDASDLQLLQYPNGVALFDTLFPPEVAPPPTNPPPPVSPPVNPICLTPGCHIECGCVPPPTPPPPVVICNVGCIKPSACPACAPQPVLLPMPPAIRATINAAPGWKSFGQARIAQLVAVAVWAAKVESYKPVSVPIPSTGRNVIKLYDCADPSTTLKDCLDRKPAPRVSLKNSANRN